MSGGSLGLRTGSYGSLLLQQQQQPRKVAKMVPPKDRFFVSIYRIAGRRKVGMLLVALVLVALVSVFVSVLYASSKEEDATEGPGISWHSYSQTHIGKRKPFLSQPQLLPEEDAKNITAPKIQPPIPENLQDLPLIINATVLLSRHPCESLVVPPPPPDSKRTGPRPCEVCYAPVEYALALMPSSPSLSPILKSLRYFSEENLFMNVSNGGSPFGGHPSLQQRNESFNIKESMTVHCGFFSGTRPGNGSGFDIDEADLLEMEKCHGLVVASAIFGNYDIIQQPKNISEIAKKHACFFMFLDEETEAYVKKSSVLVLDHEKRVGLWKVVVVHNLPYVDARRNGKVPKLLLHRLFPNARFSLWIDGKLELIVDPYQILERFLWRRNATFAISRHYRRFDVFEEAEANKEAGKYDNASIDFQVDFYKQEGLTHYSAAKLPITSDVPEGCVIIREHIPITNLFTCLWFNEVDRFTSRDQLSFSTVRDRVMSQVNWGVEMFWDCERRNFVVQAYHKELLDSMRQHPVHPPPEPPASSETARKPLPLPARSEPSKKLLPLPEPTVDSDAMKKSVGKRSREKRSSSKRRRPRIGNSRDSSST